MLSSPGADDYKAYRYNELKTLQWLKKKVSKKIEGNELITPRSGNSLVVTLEIFGSTLELLGLTWEMMRVTFEIFG